MGLAGLQPTTLTEQQQSSRGAGRLRIATWIAVWATLFQGLSVERRSKPPAKYAPVREAGRMS